MDKMSRGVSSSTIPVTRMEPRGGKSGTPRHFCANVFLSLSQGPLVCSCAVRIIYISFALDAVGMALPTLPPGPIVSGVVVVPADLLST